MSSPQMTYGVKIHLDRNGKASKDVHCRRTMKDVGIAIQHAAAMDFWNLAMQLEPSRLPLRNLVHKRVWFMKWNMCVHIIFLYFP